MGYVNEINDNNFENEVIKSQNISVVDFWAPWCGPCRKMSAVIDEVASEFEGKINVFKINTDENLKSAKEYSISGLPSILIFKDGKAIERLVGLMPKNTLANNIKKYLD
ncbi:MAG: thioredoxin [Candidatus Melainabacteria bacterium LEY3_CP_29_8]|nr:MAG: thioredoxin [Candidatus Melainabacteria bacterium LEY3_CP_29_8]